MVRIASSRFFFCVATGPAVSTSPRTSGRFTLGTSCITLRNCGFAFAVRSRLGQRFAESKGLRIRCPAEIRSQTARQISACAAPSPTCLGSEYVDVWYMLGWGCRGFATGRGFAKRHTRAGAAKAYPRVFGIAPVLTLAGGRR